MFHAMQDDCVPVGGQLRSDLGVACHALQSLWAQKQDRGAELIKIRSLQIRLATGMRNPLQGASPANPVGASGTIVGTVALIRLRIRLVPRDSGWLIPF